MALLLQLRSRTKPKPFTNPSLLHLYSTSNFTDGEPDSPVDDTVSDDQTSRNSKSPFASYFSDLKESLKQKNATTPSLRKSPSSSFRVPKFSPPQPPRSATDTIDTVRSKLQQYRNANPSSPSGDPSQQQVSFLEIYKRNAEKLGGSTGNASSRPGKVSLDAVRESLRHLKSSTGAQRDQNAVNPVSLSSWKASLTSKPSDSGGSVPSSKVIGGTDGLPSSIFSKELSENKEGEASAAFLRIYSYNDLGEKLRNLRPEGKKGEWFSLGELNQRLMRMRAMEEAESRRGFASFELRQSLAYLASQDEEKKPPLHKLDILGEIGRTPIYMMHPPQEHLLEMYFHPDNMSSAEKLKIELAKVRDEFKMSESDCGSTRVQVAQLTTKIKYLSSALHKKDVHSRKGLQAMVQRRKRLLKYLRRTDWDSYCFVITKLGLRDNPDHSHKIRTEAGSA